MESRHNYYILYKPYGIVSQFVSSHAVPLLAQLPFEWPKGIHAIGRLDRNSEGLLLLTTDSTITRLLFQDPVPHKRSYLVQVNKEIPEEKLQLLREGIKLKVGDNLFWQTSACQISRVTDPNEYCYISSEIKVYPPFSWLLITLTEGRYHQVRKMIGALHYHCKRLIRVSIEDLQLKGLHPGEIREVSRSEFFSRLKLREE